MSEQLHHAPFAWHDTLTIFIFAAMEGVCDTPLQFLAKIFSYWDLLSKHATELAKN